MPLVPGTGTGPYEIVAPLGAGGMGEVYRARDLDLRRDVALKVLAPSVAADPDRLSRFEREARLLATLNHPNIAQVYGFERAGSTPALVMELVDGDTLADRLIRGAVPMDEALAIARQIAEALAAAHEQGIVHRDLKPANIKVRADGTVKVLDFGLAKAVEPAISGVDAMNSPTISARATLQGVILGTAAYMSPEQAAGKAVDRRTDMWSFGVLLMEMLTGRRVFDGESVSHVIADVLKSDPNWSALPRDTPESVRRLLRRCLQKDPRQRLDSASAARLELEGEPDAVVTRRRATSRSAPVSLIVIAASAVTAIAAVAWTLSPRATAPNRILRLSVVLPAGQELVETGGNPLQLSPDGAAIVCTGPGPGVHGVQFYYRRLDQLEGVALPGTDNAAFPVFSPAGDWIAFPNNVTGKISKVSVQGGAPIDIAPTSGGLGLSWGDDGLYIAGDSKLVRVSPDGAGTSIIATKPDSLKLAGPFMPLPIGKSRVLAWFRVPETERLAEIDRRTGTITLLEGEAMNPIGFADGYLVFGRSSGTIGVVAFDADHGSSIASPLPVTDAALTRSAGGMIASLTPRGDLAYVRATRGSALVTLDPHGRSISEREDARLLRAPALSPDGRRVVAVAAVLQSNTDGDLLLFDMQSGEVERLDVGGIRECLDGHPMAPGSCIRCSFQGARQSSGRCRWTAASRRGASSILRLRPYGAAWRRMGLSPSRSSSPAARRQRPRSASSDPAAPGWSRC